MQEVHLDKNVKLLDCPGIVFASATRGGEGDGVGSQTAAALRNAVRVEKLEDPVTPVRQILKLCETEVVMGIYKIARFDGVDEFLRSVAFARGKLKKGGVADPEAAARVVLMDWNQGARNRWTGGMPSWIVGGTPGASMRQAVFEGLGVEWLWSVVATSAGLFVIS